MGRRFGIRYAFCIVLCFCMLFSGSISVLALDQNAGECPAEQDLSCRDVGELVERFYTVALGRDPEPEGKAFWTEKLSSREMTGADLARGFLIQSEEFRNRGLDDNTFIEVLYLTLFDRSSDEEGKTFWLSALSGGSAREEVVESFINATEWCNVCAQYGILPGAKDARATKPSDDVADFVSHFYRACLKREADEEGLASWSLRATNQEITGAEMVRDFFLSAEFEAQNVSDVEFLSRLYDACFERAPDADGEAFWLQQMASGMTRLQVIANLSGSQEFMNRCAALGIRVGRISGISPTASSYSLEFVSRFYTHCLQRTPDEEGLAFWSQRLTSGEVSGANVICEFFLSAEFSNLQTSDADFVCRLYRACFDREADADGASYWLSILAGGQTRYQVICGFVEAQEFRDLCARYSIPCGILDRANDPLKPKELPKQYVEPVIPGGVKWYGAYVDPRTVRAELIADPSDLTVLCNKYYSAPLDYVPVLVPVRFSNGQYLRPEAAAAWEAMHDACKAATGKDLYLISGYRSQSTQRNSFYNCISRKGLEHACAMYAWPGRSEHPLGVGLDIGTRDHPSISQSFTSTVAGQWVLAHGYEYGFIWRYPAGYGHITGIGQEGWHFRYVGVEIATEMHNKGIMTLEEYYGKPQSYSLANQ